MAALSARLMAEAAARDGFGVVALDVHGDIDTRRAALDWLPIGAAASAPRLDPQRLLDALHGLARRRGGDEAIGWIAGSGFEGEPDLLAAGAKLLPLIGTDPADVRRVRDPKQFFAALTAHRIAHPTTQALAPADPDGWLSKDANACGGWHIRAAAEAPEVAAAPASRYFQREMTGTPMSATFIADGRDALLLGCNELIVRPFASDLRPHRHPHVYCGCVGPVAVSARVAGQVGDAVRLLTSEFALRGWCSLDFMRDDDDRIGVLEVNARPSASMALYPPRGQVDAHLRACLFAELPRREAFMRSSFADTWVTGSRIIYARRRLQIDDDAARRLAEWPNAHDLPVAGSCIEPGAPLCSLTAEADGAEQVQALLLTGHDALLDILDTAATLERFSLEKRT